MTDLVFMVPILRMGTREPISRSDHYPKDATLNTD